MNAKANVSLGCTVPNLIKYSADNAVAIRTPWFEGAADKLQKLSSDGESCTGEYTYRGTRAGKPWEVTLTNTPVGL